MSKSERSAPIGRGRRWARVGAATAGVTTAMLITMLGGAGSASAFTCVTSLPVTAGTTVQVAVCHTGPVTQGVRWQ
jgi:hypothetical protein